MQDIIDLIMNNGIGIVCVAYLIWWNANIGQKISDTLTGIADRLTKIETKLEMED